MLGSTCSLLVFCCRFLQLSSREPPAGLELLTQLVGQKRSEDEGSLWRNLRLDWVRNWDKSCQTAIILSRFHHSGASHTPGASTKGPSASAVKALPSSACFAVDLNSCESTVLWRYLTSLHDHQRVLGWIGGAGQTSSAPRWPELAPEVVNSNTMCSTYMRENILDLLARYRRTFGVCAATEGADAAVYRRASRRSVFIPDELADLEQLLWRLAQGGGVMTSFPPVPQYRSPLSLDFHSCFITFCQDRNLQYLLYTYLEHYR